MCCCCVRVLRVRNSFGEYLLKILFGSYFIAPVAFTPLIFSWTLFPGFTVAHFPLFFLCPFSCECQIFLIVWSSCHTGIVLCFNGLTVYRRNDRSWTSWMESYRGERNYSTNILFPIYFQLCCFVKWNMTFLGLFLLHIYFWETTSDLSSHAKIISSDSRSLQTSSFTPRKFVILNQTHQLFKFEWTFWVMYPHVWQPYVFFYLLINSLGTHFCWYFHSIDNSMVLWRKQMFYTKRHKKAEGVDGQTQFSSTTVNEAIYPRHVCYTDWDLTCRHASMDHERISMRRWKP